MGGGGREKMIGKGTQAHEVKEAKICMHIQVICKKREEACNVSEVKNI